jgi:hypothetical protein
LGITETTDSALGKPSGAAAIRHVSTRILAALAFFAAFEGGLFHSGIYSYILEPESTTGGMELMIGNEILRPKPDRNQVLAVGHSRQALMPRIANTMQPPTGYTFALVGLGGTTARVWYYDLRAVDPDAHNYAAILIPEDDYNEPDSWDIPTDRVTDLHYVIARLHLEDLRDFPWSFRRRNLQWTAFEGIVLKGTVYKQDFLEFLEHPLERIKKAQWYQRDSAGWYYGYTGDERTLAGLVLDWAHRTVLIPPNVPDSEQKIIRAELFPDRPPDEGREAAFRLYWYRKMVQHYRGTSTKLLFFRVPRAPIAPPDVPEKLNSAVRQLAIEPGVVVLDEHLLDSLEQPEFFWDGMHLNREGQIRFTRILATEVRRVLGAPQP